jgi:hypothetical protein
MAGLNTLEASNVVLPQDLVITAQPNIDTNYFTVTAKGLELDSSYNFQFQWVYEDGTVGPWSPSVFVITPTESAPGAPSVTVPGTSIGYIPVTLSTFPENALRVDVKVTGGDLGSGKLVHSFSSAGTITVAAKAGFYYVELYTVTPTGINGTPTSVFEITVSDVGEVIQSPTNPNGFTSKRILAGIEVSWAGTYANSTFTGFEAINIYAGSSATATAGTYEQVGVLTGNNVKNTIVVPLGTYVVYGQPVYIHAAAVNKANPPTVGTIQANVTNQVLGPGKATDADINDGAIVYGKIAANAVTVDMLAAGSISSTSYIRAGTKSTDGLTGARVEISSSTITQTGTNVLPGLTVYASDGTQLLRAPLTGGLTINGSGTFTGSITGASGQFNGDLGASGGDFTVRSGIVTALAGEIGGWKITSSSIYSSNNTSVNRMALYPNIPQLSLIAPSSFKIELDPTVGLKFSKISDNAGNTVTSIPFQISPNGNMVLAGSITSTATIDGGTITGTTITGAIFTSKSYASGNGIRIIDNAGLDQMNFQNSGVDKLAINVNSSGATLFGPGLLSNIAMANNGGVRILATSLSVETAGNIVTFGSNGSVRHTYGISAGTVSFRSILAATASPSDGDPATGFDEGVVYLVY